MWQIVSVVKVVDPQLHHSQHAKRESCDKSYNDAWKLVDWMLWVSTTVGWTKEKERGYQR